MSDGCLESHLSCLGFVIGFRCVKGQDSGASTVRARQIPAATRASVKPIIALSGPVAAIANVSFDALKSARFSHLLTFIEFRRASMLATKKLPQGFWKKVHLVTS